MTTVAAADHERARRLQALAAGEVLPDGGITAGVGLLYWAIGAAALNTPGHLDPWIYRALFVNFDYLYRAFPTAYYPTRLPWVIPGEIVHAILPSTAAFFVLHSVYILATGAAVYATLRRFFGRGPALVGYAVLLLDVIFYNAHSDDYPDGAQITYLTLTLACAALGFGARRRPWWFVASGFFATAAFGTNLWDAFFVTGLAVVYVAVVSTEANLGARIVRDISAFAAGVVLLLVSVGTYARLHGGEFLFFMPSVRVARSLATSNWRLHGYGWMLQEPRVLACVFVTCVGGLVFWPSRGRWRNDIAVRFAGGVLSALAVTSIGLAVWEFLLGGIAVFDIPYYFSVFTPLLVLAAGVTVALAMRADRPRRPASAVLAAVAVAGAPVALVYGVPLRGLVGRTGFWIVCAAGIVGLVLASAGARPRRTASATLAAALAAVGVLELSAAASRSSTRFSMPSAGPVSFSERLATASLADQLMSFMRRERLQSLAPGESPANFWLNQQDVAVDSIQSSYLYGITAAGLALPRLDAPMKRLLAVRKPPTLVLLCRSGRVCEQGVEALRHAHFAPRLQASATLAARDQQLLVRAYTLPRYSLGGPEARFYRPSRSTLVPLPAARSVRGWRLDHGLPQGWSGEALRNGGIIETSPKRWRYELQSPDFELQPGRYEAFLDGRVLRGGLELGILDTDAQRWIAQRGYWHGQSFPPGRWMATPFTLADPTKIAIVLENWVPTDVSSRWRLHELRLVRLES